MELSENFNKGLLSSKDDKTEEILPSDDDNSSGELEIPPTDVAENYYNSPAWNRKISEQIENFANMSHLTKLNRQSHTQPSNITTQPIHHPHRNTRSTQATTEESLDSTQTSHLPTLNLFVPGTAHRKFTTWHFPQWLSQSTIAGRNGRNGYYHCTFHSKTLLYFSTEFY